MSRASQSGSPSRGALARVVRSVARRVCVLLMLALFVSLICSRAGAQTVCATPGAQGPANSPALSGIVNTYFPGAATASAGATSIQLGTIRAAGSATTISIGDLLLVIQMQDGTFNSSNVTTTPPYGAGNGTGRGLTSAGGAGLYEYVIATSASGGGGSVTIRGAGAGNGLINAYTNAAANATAGAGAQGVRRFQVIRVPQYSSATLSGTVTAPMWDGSTGGVVAFDVAGLLNLNSGTINVAGLGFRGGGGRALVGGRPAAATVNPANNDYAYFSSTPSTSTVGAHGSKGEGTLGTPRYVFNPQTNAVNELSPTAEGYPNGSYAMGAPGNAGGGGTDSKASTNNEENSGGGGGANGGDGGHGGNTWNTNAATGGLGGVAASLGAGRVVFGGGGGAGSRNNSVNYDSSGASGGGIVLLRTNSVTGTGTINADGNAAWNNTVNDGGGGGGAGGSVVVTASPLNSLAGLTINARGGRGGDAWRALGTTLADRHGPGGGGGGGFVAQTGGASAFVTGGAHGVTTTLLDAYNSTDGASGQTLAITQTQVPGVSSGAQCVASLTTTKTTSTASVNNSSAGTTATYTITVANAAVRAAATTLSISDALPAGFTYASTTSVTMGGGATRSPTTNPTVGDAIPTWSTFSIPGGGSVTIVFTVNVASSVAGGTYQNPATATYLDPRRTITTGTTTASYDSASSTGEDVTVLDPPILDMQKRCTSPANCESAAQQPNTDLTYTITFTNIGDQTARNIVIKDIIPFSVNIPAATIIRSTQFKVGSLALTPGSSGLTLPASGMKYYSDAINYPPPTPPWNPVTSYTPPGAAGTYDANVTYVAWQLTGTLAPGASASVSFTVRIK